MSKFRVGQRVRVIEPLFKKNYGVTGTVVALYPEVDGPWIAENCDVRWDDGHPYQAHHTSRLEPATDCYDKAEWETCLWKPDHLRVGA